MFIIQAILRAKTEYVVYFMLSSWLESLEHDRSAATLPVEAKRLPLRGSADVRRRFAAVREKLNRIPASAAASARVLRDAAATLGVACEMLNELTPPSAPYADLSRTAFPAVSRAAAISRTPTLLLPQNPAASWRRPQRLRD